MTDRLPEDRAEEFRPEDHLELVLDAAKEYPLLGQAIDWELGCRGLIAECRRLRAEDGRLRGALENLATAAEFLLDHAPRDVEGTHFVVGAKILEAVLPDARAALSGEVK